MPGAVILMFPYMPRTKNIPDRDYPNRVREFRLQRGLTLKQLEEMTGIFFTHIGKMETGERPMRDFHMAKFAEALGVEAADLLPMYQGGLSEGERRMIDTYRDLTPEAKRMLEAMIESQQDAREGKGIVELSPADFADQGKKAVR